MRIGFDATVLSPATRYSGVGEYTHRLLPALASAFPDDEFILYAAPGAAATFSLRPNQRWVHLPSTPLGRASAATAQLLALPMMASAQKIDVMHTPTVHTRASMPPVPSRLPCPLVVTVHDIIPLTYYARNGDALPWRMRTFYGWNLRRALRAEHIVTVSEASKRDIVAECGLDGDRISVVYNGIDDDEGPPSRMTSLPQPYILYVGSYEPRKNLRRLLDGFEEAVAGGLPHHLVLVVEAESGHKAALHGYAERLDCAGRLRFLHSLDDATMHDVYAGAEMFVFPSLYEGFGLPPLQAMAAGVPVISSPAGSLHEVLGEAAVYVDPAEATTIAAAIQRLAADPGLRERLAGEGRRQAALYSWDKAAKETMDVYRSVASLSHAETA
ncbi:MAG TPA: glycosyltransferase family 1 protein [Dehalococcoidia bacterium]